MNLGKVLDKFQESIQESFSFSFSKPEAFRRWSKFRWTNLFACMKQEYKAKREKVICPKFCKYADLKCQALYSAWGRFSRCCTRYSEGDGAGINNILMSIFI